MSARHWLVVERLETLRALDRWQATRDALAAVGAEICAELDKDAPARRPYSGDCPDCSALDGQPCDAGCLRYREDPDA